MNRATQVLALLSIVALVGACNDDGTLPTKDAQIGDTGGADDTGGGDDAGGGGGLSTPATETMATGIGGTAVSAAICQSLAFGGGIGWSLAPNSASLCLGGAAYLRFSLDDSVYRVTAGVILTATGPGDTVAITSTSVGSITQDTTGADEVTDLPEDTDVTIATRDHGTITFSFSGNDVTVKAFE